MTLGTRDAHLVMGIEDDRASINSEAVSIRLRRFFRAARFSPRGRTGLRPETGKEPLGSWFTTRFRCLGRWFTIHRLRDSTRRFLSPTRGGQSESHADFDSFPSNIELYCGARCWLPTSAGRRHRSTCSTHSYTSSSWSAGPRTSGSHRRVAPFDSGQRKSVAGTSARNGRRQSDRHELDACRF